jgi:hypothetical protein
MSYNLQTWTKDGFLQIDGLYSSYALIAQGTINVPSSLSGTQGTTAWNKRGPDLTYPDYGQIPLIAIGDTGGYGIIITHVTKTSARLYLRAGGTNWANDLYYVGGSTSINLPYRVYTPVKVVTPSNDTYGFRIYDGNGVLIYDAGLPTLVTVYFSDVTLSNGTYATRLNTPGALRVRPVGNYIAEPTGYDPPATLYSDIGTTISTGYSGIYVVASDAQGNEEAAYIGFYQPPLSGVYIIINPKYWVNSAAGQFRVDMGADPFGYYPVGAGTNYENAVFRPNVKLKNWAIRG